MEENNQLERFFRKRIKNYKPESDQWEEDLNDVWNNALPHISKPAAASRTNIWSYLFGTFLIGLLGYYFLHQKQELNDLKETITTTKNTVQELQKELQEIEYQNEQKDEKLKIMSSIIEASKTDKSSFVNEINPISSKHTFNSKQNILSNIEINIKDIQGTKSAKSTVLQEKNSISETIKERNINALDTLAFSPIAALNIENSKSIDPLKLPKEKNKKITWAKLKVAPVLINRKLKNFNGPNDPFVRRDLSGLQFGFDFGRDISKRLSIESGINYFQFSSKNTHSKSLIFSSDEEQMTPLGLLRTSKSFILRTPIGLSSGNYIFTRKPTDFIADGTSINATFNSEVIIQYLRMPLLLNYKIKQGRCQLYAKAGLVGDIVMKNNFELKEVFTDNPVLSFNRANTNQPKKLQDFTLNYLVGLGFEYALNKHWSISLEPTYTRGITPQAKPFGEIEVSLETASLVAGAKYHF